MSERRARPVAPFGVNLAGHLTAPQGLGVAARNTAHALDERGTPWAGIDVPPPAASGERVAELAPRLWPAYERAPYPVNLLHLNPPEVLELLWAEPRWLELDRRVTASVPFWEFPRFPRAWLDGLACMDAVLAPSRFVRDAVQRALPDLPVFHFAQAVWLPDDVRADRARFGIPPGACAFVTAFDTRSDFARKNPLGALEAFARAFADRPAGDGGVRLLLRIQNARGRAAVPGSPEATLRARAARDARVMIVDGTLSRDDVLSLVASCDAYVSLHRAEGLGLGPLEAMALGRPAVATAWSGNLDYMTEHDSLLVPAREVAVSGTSIGAYQLGRMGGGQTWAEPDLDAAARHMKILAEDPALRARLGARAAEAALRQAEASRSGSALGYLRELSERRAQGGAPSAACAAARVRVRRQRLLRRTRRQLVDLLRAIGGGRRDG
jgi:glycosyltransferase involved in cell wall biosynthesis